MRRFELMREEDLHGVSGVGKVAEGVEFTSGGVALTWLSPFSCVAFYPSITTLEAVHGHGGKSTVAFIDPPGSDDPMDKVEPPVKKKRTRKE